MGVNISVWNIMASMRAVDKWTASAQANIGGSAVVGYKQFDVTFGGGNATTILSNPSMMRAGIQIAEQLVTLAHTSIDWRQGDVITSPNDYDFAIQGEGFFMVADARGQIFYTRDGQFRESTTGTLVNKSGLTYIDRALAINLGLYTAPAPTAAEIDANNTGWVNKSGTGWFPYVAGTIYDEGGTSYQNMTINAKKTFFVDTGTLAPGTQSFTVNTDDQGFPILNGIPLTSADIISGAHPSSAAINSTYDITPYLKNGANTLTFQVSELTGANEHFNIISSTVPNLDNNNWAVEVTTPTTGASPVGIQDILKTDKKDMILGLPVLNNLNYSRYGSTIFEESPANRAAIVDMPELQGLGQLKQRFLEASNTNLSKQITGLSASNNAYTVLAKQLNVYWQNFDVGLNLLK
jgi:flagellar hook-basal body protein